MLFVCLFLLSSAQPPLYEYLDFEKTLTVPESINSGRTAVIVQVPDERGDFRTVGPWQTLSERAHKAFVTMGIDAVFYINHYSLVVSDKSKKSFRDLFSLRRIENLIFLTQTDLGYEIMMGDYSGTTAFMSTESPVFYYQNSQLYDLLLQVGREIKRADYTQENLLIPERPNFLSGISIVEKSLLKNYPGILRRSKLVAERFEKMPIAEDSKPEVKEKIDAYNAAIEEKNKKFEELMEGYPYEYEFIDPMSDEDLLRNRYQFVLRSISGQASTLREMLNYEVSRSETDYVSTIPVMPDQTRAKPIPRESLVHKFYIKQNISKNIHVGVWDADVTWEDALKNLIGNLIQEHNVDK